MKNAVLLSAIFATMVLSQACGRGQHDSSEPALAQQGEGRQPADDIATPVSGTMPLTVTFRDNDSTNYGEFPPVLDYGDGHSQSMTFVPHPCLAGNCPGYYTAAHVYTTPGKFTAVIRDGRKLPCPSCNLIFAQTTITVNAAND